MMKDGKTTRERLIEAAHLLALQKGFDRMSVADVMAATGVGKGAVYHHFPGKDSLGLAVLERDRAAFMAMIVDCLAAPTPLAGLDRFFATALITHRQMGFVGGCLWGNTALEMSDSNPVFAQVVAEVFAEWRDRLATTIRAAQEQGQVRTDCSAADLARAVVATIEGGIMLSRLTKDEAPLRTCLATLRTMLTTPGTPAPEPPALPTTTTTAIGAPESCAGQS